jgi:hypothetical protein
MKPLLLAALLLVPSVALAQNYLPEPTLAAAQNRSNQLCLQVGCGTGSTDYLESTGSFANGQGYVVIPQSGPYALPMTNAIGTAALSPGEIASELTASQVSPALAIQTPPQIIAAGQAWTFTLPAGTFTDPRGEALTYDDGDSTLSWLSMTGETLSGTPPTGTYSITVTATDQSGFTASETFQVTAQ